MLVRSLSLSQQRVILAVLGLIIFGAGLGLRDPWPADEPRFALVAKEMVQTGQWLIPHRAGEIYADKPPLFFWMVATLYALTGSIRVAFLLPAAISGILVTLLVHDLARRLYTARAAMLTALALLCSVQFVMQARSGQIDGVLLLWTTLGMYGLSRHLLTGPSKIWWYIGFAAAGAGVITKGVGFLPLLLLIPARWTPARKTFNWKMIATGFAVTIGVILLWLVPMLIYVERSNDPALTAYRDNILFRQTGQRYAAAWHHYAWFGYFLVEVIPWAWLPLTLLLPWTIPAFRRRFRRRDPETILFLGWVVLVLLFFSVSRGKRGVYILPALPAFVLAHGELLAGLIRRPSVGRVARIASACIAALTAIVGIALLVRPSLPEKGGLVPTDVQAMAIGMLLISAAGIGAALIRRHSMAAFAAVLGLMWVIAGWGVLPQINEDRSASKFMREVESQIGPRTQLGILAWREQFALQASRPVHTFGYGRSDFDAEGREGARWLLAAPDRRLLVTAKHSLCFDMQRSKALEERSRHQWFLAGPEAVNPVCAQSVR